MEREKKKRGVLLLQLLHEYAYDYFVNAYDYLRHMILKLAQADDADDDNDGETRRGAETKLLWYDSLA